MKKILIILFVLLPFISFSQEKETKYYYYENGDIKTEINYKKGVWTTYYENGNLKSKQDIKNRNYDIRYQYSKEGKLLFPFTVPQKSVGTDSLIINNTELKVWLMFDSWDFPEESSMWHTFIECRDGGLNDPWLNNLTLTMCENKFIIQDSTTVVLKQFGYSPQLLLNKKAKSLANTSVVRKDTVLPDGTETNMQVYGEVICQSSFGEIVITRKAGCDDTARSPFTLNYKGNFIYFKEIGNLNLYEYDANNNGKNELYIMNYYLCGGRIIVYKIDDN